MKRMAVTGFIIWLVATIALRLGGQYVFGHVPALLLLLITIPVMAFVARALLRRFPTTEQRAVAAIALVAPGMLLDTFSAIWLPAIFPNIRAGCSGLFRRMAALLQRGGAVDGGALPAIGRSEIVRKSAALR